jgi:hypothetical protein
LHALTGEVPSPTFSVAWFGEGNRAQRPRRDGTMRESRRDARRVARRVLAALAVSDIAYRMFVREPLRRALGIEAKHA